MRWLKGLRFFYVVLACIIGALSIAFSAAAITDGFRVDSACLSGPDTKILPGGETVVENCYGFDGPEPLSFSYYGGMPLIALLFFLSAYAAWKNRWETAGLAWWFFMPAVIMELVYATMYPFDLLLNVLGTLAIIAIFPIAALVLTYRLAARFGHPDGGSPQISSEVFSFNTERIYTILVLVVAAAFACGAAVVWLAPPEHDTIILVGRGAELSYLNKLQFLLGILLVVIAAFKGGNPRLINPALMAALFVTVTSFLEALDVLIGFGGSAAKGFVFFSAAAFIASVVALVISPRLPPRDQTRHITWPISAAPPGV